MLKVVICFKRKAASFFIVLLVISMVVISRSASAAAPKITKAFNPDSIVINEFVTMTIGFLNPNSQAARFTAPFSESLPTGVIILGSASNSCGGKLKAEPGSSKFTLENAKIPAYGGCNILLGITAAKAGRYESKTEVSALQTDRGKNSRSSDAILIVVKSELSNSKAK